MGLNEFVEGAVGAIGNVGKAAAWTANPTHWDDIARGVGAVGNYVAENPGQVWDTGFEVGRSILKDQLDPVNLAINAGLIGLTVATGGAAAPALAAKIGLGAKSVQAGVEGVKLADTAVDVVKGVRTGAKALDTAGDALKTVDAVGDAAQAVQSGGRLGSFLRGQAGSLGKVDSMLDVGKFSRWTSPIETRAGAGAMRAGWAEKILAGGARESPSLGRQITAAAVQGSSRRAPTQLAGMSDEVYGAQKMMWRGQRVMATGEKVAGAQGTAESAQEGVAIAADPGKAAMGYATERANKSFLQPSQMPMPTVAASNQTPYTVQGMDWSQVGTGGGAAGRTQSYGPATAYNNGRGFHQSPNSVDWGSVMPSSEEAYA